MSSDDEEISDVDSFASVEMNIESLKFRICELYGETEELESHLLTMEKPLTNLKIDQLGQLPFLEASPFRHATFQVKKHLPGVDSNKRYPFHVICEKVRDYLIEKKAYDNDGQIILNKQLANLFEVEEGKIGYISLLGKLRSVLY